MSVRGRWSFYAIWNDGRRRELVNCLRKSSLGVGFFGTLFCMPPVRNNRRLADRNAKRVLLADPFGLGMGSHQKQEKKAIPE